MSRKASETTGNAFSSRKLRKRQKTWEQQRLYSIKNPLMGKAVANPYGGGRVSAGPPPIGVPPANLQYNNVDDVP
ncbi:hypothetical protein HPB48_019590 [Haemaphysalis longicornis]|uniref:Uncharacterized protein n=1 Tax=Haemaphysalis longicornis TaxID=44386 RepID=A0A9J6FG31_HAELO|nr:hypothetical protein HPB48_019590 [Haemaphysalis longicornis]